MMLIKYFHVLLVLSCIFHFLKIETYSSTLDHKLYLDIKNQNYKELVNYLNLEQLHLINSEYKDPFNGETFLTLALKYLDEDSISQMLNLEFFSLANNKQGESPLSLAAKLHSVKIIQSILAQGSAENIFDRDPHHFIYYLMARTDPTESSLKSLNMIISKAIKLKFYWYHRDQYHFKNQSTQEKLDLLDFSLRNNLSEIIRTILLTVDFTSHSSETNYLCTASEHNNLEAVNLLLMRGGEPNVQCPNGQFPIHHAVLNQNVKMITALYTHGSNIDQLNESFLSPIMIATMHKYYKVYRLLMILHADPLLKSSFI